MGKQPPGYKHIAVFVIFPIVNTGSQYFWNYWLLPSTVGANDDQKLEAGRLKPSHAQKTKPTMIFILDTIWRRRIWNFGKKFKHAWAMNSPVSSLKPFPWLKTHFSYLTISGSLVFDGLNLLLDRDVQLNISPKLSMFEPSWSKVWLGPLQVVKCH